MSARRKWVAAALLPSGVPASIRWDSAQEIRALITAGFRYGFEVGDLNRVMALHVRYHGRTGQLTTIVDNVRPVPALW